MNDLYTTTPGKHGNAKDLIAFTDADAALDRISKIYDEGVGRIQTRFAQFAKGDKSSPMAPAYYPYLGLSISPEDIKLTGRLAYGNLHDAGSFGVTLTQPELFLSYYREQIDLVLRNHNQPVYVGISDREMPLPFVIEAATTGISAEDVQALQSVFSMPDLSRINDNISNGLFVAEENAPKPLALFTAERVDYSLLRLSHYTGTSPPAFPAFCPVYKLSALCRRVH